MEKVECGLREILQEGERRNQSLCKKVGRKGASLQNWTSGHSGHNRGRGGTSGGEKILADRKKESNNL